MMIACGHTPLGALAAHGTAARGTSGAHADMDHTVDHGTFLWHITSVRVVACRGGPRGVFHDGIIV